MNFFDQVSALIRAGGSFEDLGRGVARNLDTGHLLGFVLYGAPERCLVTVPYQPPEAVARLREAFEHSDWRGRPREAFLSAFASLGIPTGEIGEAIRWAFLGREEEPLGAVAFVRDPAASPPPESERRAADFFLRLAGQLALAMARAKRHERAAGEPDYLLHALNQVGRLMLERPERGRLLPSLLKIALDVARTEVGSILLESNGRFATEVEWGLPGDLLEGIHFVPGDQGIVERVTRTLEPVIVDDFSGPTVRLPLGFPRRITSLVAIPLLAGDRLTGILNVATGEKGREMLLSTVEALATLAVLIATAVENARLQEILAQSARQANQGRAEEQNLLRRVLGSLDEGVLVSDAAGCIVLANPAAEEMLGMGGAGERHFPERNVVALRPFFAWLRERWTLNLKREESEYRLAVHPPAVLVVSITPLSSAGDRLGHVTVIRDDLAAGRARWGDRRVTAARIASEMEPPLLAARAALSLERPSSTGPDRDLHPRLTRRGLERLTALAEDLRDYALLEAGRLEIEKSEFFLEEAVAAALVELAEELREKRIAFQGPEPALSGLIRADRGRIIRALSRLLAAAVRSSEECGWIQVGLARTGEAASLSIMLSASPASQELEGPLGLETSAEAGGPGGHLVSGALGLFLARRVVELHGGRVSVRSDEGHEVRLVVELPLGGTAPESVKAAPEVSDGLGSEF